MIYAERHHGRLRYKVRSLCVTQRNGGLLTPSLLPPLSVQDWLALFSLEENLVAPLLWHAVFDPRRDGHVAFRNFVFGLAWVGRHPVSPCASQGLPP